ncbi:RusA family crossover junction endodeoxyribonuclease [Erwiniaceae bacterium L1_54_3]|nr:RusA family crossover junction endodeoxyribonuclease [Erwiniaceae bacterium L1_54_3]
MQTYDILPMGKPRMTQRDKFTRRPETNRYWAFKAEVRLRGVSVPESGCRITFVLPMPDSWSKKKRAEHIGRPHQKKPDVDNLHKALMDALFDDDCIVWDARITKIWGEKGQIKIEKID